MKIKTLLCISITTFAVVASGCVLQTEFDQYVADTQDKQVESDLAIKILLCESRNDSYQDMLDTDEPNPTRRDEPSSTRRDEACEKEFDDIVGSNLQMCRDKMNICTEPTTDGGAGLPGPQCRGCYANCLNTGTWDEGTCDLP